MIQQNLGYNKKIGLVLVVAALLIFFHFVGLLRPVENLLVRLVRPTAQVSYSVGTDLDNWTRSDVSPEELQSLLEASQSEVKRLTVANAQLEYLKEENDTLRQYHDFFETNSFNYVLAKVLVENLAGHNPLEHTQLIINRGSQDGLQSGLLVLDQDGLIVGRLKQVDKYKSTVALITSPDCRLAVAIQPNFRTAGIAQGESGLTIRINFIPQSEAVHTGDAVVTSGLEENLPSGLVLGKLGQINRESNELWQNAVVEPLASLDNLTVVSVVLPVS